MWGEVSEPCSVLHTGGDTIMLLLKRKGREHHSTSSPAFPSPRSRLKLYQTGRAHTCGPGLCQAPADVVQRFAKNPKAKKIFLLLISCSLQRFYFVKKKRKKVKVLWRNPRLRSYRLTSRALEQSVTFQRCDFVPRCFSRLSFLSNTNKRTK